MGTIIHEQKESAVATRKIVLIRFIPCQNELKLLFHQLSIIDGHGKTLALPWFAVSFYR